MIFELGSGTTSALTDIGNAASSTFSSISGVIFLVLGILLAFLVVEKIIDALIVRRDSVE